MQGFRRQGPEIPHGGGRAHVSFRMAFLRVDEVRELVGVPHEEHGRVVAHHVPVAVLGVEFQRETAHVALMVSGTGLAGHSGEARDHRRFGAGLKHLGFRVSGNVAGDREFAVGTPAFGVNGALGNALAILVRQLFDQLIVLQQNGAAFSGGQGVLVVGNRRTGGSGEGGLVGHDGGSSHLDVNLLEWF